MATPPRAAVHAGSGTVRAASSGEAGEYAAVLDELRPRLLETLPDACLDEPVEVWLQDTPTLYAFPASASLDAEGLWSERHGRILLSRDADHPVRTLAHELTHAALGPSWSALPGTLEEGLCDVVAGHLVPDGAARLRAGRLASAALATGGLRLRFELWPLDADRLQVEAGPRAGSRPRDAARLVLTGRDSAPFDPLLVFRVEAGLSTTSLQVGTKRGYYGLAYLVVGSIVERAGLEGLHRLCLEARAAGHERVPEAWLLRAAGLGSAPSTFRELAAAGFGPLETRELLGMYPAVTQDGARDLMERAAARGEDPDALAVWVTVEGSGRAVRVLPREGATLGRALALPWKR